MVPNRATHRICNWNERFENERSIEKCSRGINCCHLVASAFDISTIFLNWPREEWLVIHFENSLVRNIGYLSRILFFIFHMTNQITFCSPFSKPKGRSCWNSCKISIKNTSKETYLFVRNTWSYKWVYACMLSSINSVFLESCVAFIPIIG